MTKSLKLTLLALFLFQILVSAGFELAHDEAYYWLYSKHLDWGYFDHPPFVGIVIKLFSFLPAGEVSVRVGFILLQFATVLLLIRMTKLPKVTTLLFYSFPLASLAGLLALPDIPLLFMTALYCWGLKKYLEKDELKNSLCLGGIIALLLYAKYHGVLLIFFTIVAIPRLLLRKSFYLVAGFSFLLFFPHLWWQYQHEFSTLRYHFIERPKSSFSILRSLEYIGLQIILAGFVAGPVVWFALMKEASKDQFLRAMKFISIGTVAFFLFSSFSKKVEANWTIFLAPPMILFVAENELWSKIWVKRTLLVSFFVVVVIRVAFLLPTDLISIKRLKEFKGWNQWAKDIQQVCGNEPILANSYQVASKLSYYLQTEIQALNYHSRKNQFDYWRFDKRIPTEQVCYITDKSDFSGITFKTPEGKTISIVKNQSLTRLWELKYNESR